MVLWIIGNCEMNNLFVFISCNAIYELEYLKRFWIVLAKNFKSCFCDGLNQWKWMQRSAKTKAKTKTVQIFSDTGRSFSDALLFPEHGKSMLCTKIVLNVRNNFCTQNVLLRFELGISMCWTWNLMNNLSSYCGLVDAKIRASDKDLPVQIQIGLELIVTWKPDQTQDWHACTYHKWHV